MGAGVGCWGLGFSSLPHPPAPYPRLEELRSRGARGVDVGTGHMAVTALDGQYSSSAWVGLDAREFYGREARALSAPDGPGVLRFTVFLGWVKKTKAKASFDPRPLRDSKSCTAERALRSKG